MRKSSYVFPGAQFQAANNYRNTYAFTRQILTTISADVLADSLSEELTATLQDARIEMDSTYVLNGIAFHTKKITGMIRDKRVFYLTSVIDHQYQIFHFSSWMFIGKRDIWEEDFEQMLHSWRR
jgi:hypothetical protein